MDPSAFIFVGLAVAWAAYLIPKALEHHDAGARSRSVDKFSDTMRVLARREAVDRRKTQLVTNRKPSAAETPVEPAAEPVQELDAEHPDTKHPDTKHPDTKHPDTEHPDTKHPDTEHPDTEHADTEHTGFFAAQTFVRRSAGSRAARRRRRVLGGLLVLLAMVAAAAAGRVIGWWWVAAPVVLLAAWLFACRKMVTAERAVRRPVVQRVTDPVEPETPGVEDAVRIDDSAAVPVVRAEVAAPIASGDGWELVPVTLPTYVSKPPARRPVSTIDLDSTGVWTSGRTAADSALVQQAEAARAAGTEAVTASPQAQRRVSGA